MNEVPVFLDGCEATVHYIQTFPVCEVVSWKAFGELFRN